jgi:cytochrome b subunit of formate dehydrogenase
MSRAAVANLVKRTIQWLLLAVTVLFLITGFGITEFRVVETITLGWLSKSWALRLHDNLWIPLLVLLVLHVCLPFIFRQKAREKEL